MIYLLVYAENMKLQRRRRWLVGYCIPMNLGFIGVLGDLVFCLFGLILYIILKTVTTLRVNFSKENIIKY